MGINEIAATFEIVSRCLSAEGLFALYGPFKENGLHNSDGNIAFDKTLRSEDPKMGIRDIAELARALSHRLCLMDHTGHCGLPSTQQAVTFFCVN